MSADFLVELGTEELPPKALLSLSEAFTQGIVDRLKAENLNFGEVTAYAAPRRLALVIKNLDTQAPNSELVAWGPPVAVAFDAEGQPTRAAEAFAKKNGLDVIDKARTDGSRHEPRATVFQEAFSDRQINTLCHHGPGQPGAR